MTPELKRALEVIRHECRKLKAVENCKWLYTARCNLICEACGYNIYRRHFGAMMESEDIT